MSLDAAQAQRAWDAPARNEARAGSLRPATVLIAHADFLACIDNCVRELITETGSDRVLRTAGQQLRTWLDGNTQTLENGTPIDFALFDNAILSIEERLPQAGSPAQRLHASRLLAESVYAVKR